jgi:hypothetical protein
MVILLNKTLFSSQINLLKFVVLTKFCLLKTGEINKNISAQRRRQLAE